MKNIGKPCAGEPHARFDEGGQVRACSLLYASSAVSACGEDGSGVRRKARVKPASVKQEVSFDHVCA